jgi:isopenicillin-N epimerase
VPRFGHQMLEHWMIDPEITYLNHGTVGAPPRRTLAAQQAIRDEVERQPARFMLRELSGIAVGVPTSKPPRMRVAAAEVADFLGVRGEDLVFVENATSGINAILRSLEFRQGDEILIADHAYGAIAHAASFVARRTGARVVPVELPFPAFEADALVEAFSRHLGPRTRLAIVDHVTSESAWLLPVPAIAARCRERGVPVLVDGAHGPGALAFDIPSLGVDWYVGNLHKWAFAPRSCGILWAPSARQADLHPAVISWGLDRGFVYEFDWAGTRDPSAYLAAPEGIRFLRELGLEAVYGYNHDLAWEGANALAGAFGTELAVNERRVGCMATVPLPERIGSSAEDAARLRDALLFEDRIEAQIHAWRGRLWTRLSAQIYNEMADVERLAAAVLARA